PVVVPLLDDEAPKLGLVLTGGGARAAYQVGVLKGIAELVRRGSGSPFSVITGTSAGAVSAVALASDPAHFRQAVYAIERVWRDFRVHQVFKADAASVFRSGLHWMLALLSGGWLVRPPPSLFDNSPLWELLRGKLNFDAIPRGLYKKHLSAIGICATSYANADSVTFYACASAIDPWRRAFRKGARVQLTLEHLMASLAIPFLFRPIYLQDQYYGDGAMRQTSPLSPAIHLGANRLLVIGVGDADTSGLGLRNPKAEPTFGQMFGFMLDSLFMDQLHADLEHIKVFNQIAGARHIEALVITPSRDLSEIARRHRDELPRSLRMLLRTWGANNSAGTQLLSYLLFERGYTRELIALGQSDARARAAEIREFLALEHAPQYRSAESA
ncbi:MAG: patatin-like phospholipase family protein, partial [Pseudomonadota bacterium]|nr:patatin-like phospholipase family protein [Pseudomonadota bacterium]